jgi:hypothetical protein
MTRLSNTDADVSTLNRLHPQVDSIPRGNEPGGLPLPETGGNEAEISLEEVSGHKVNIDKMNRVCARIFLYTQGLSVDPLLCLELSLDSLRRLSAPGPGPAAPPDFSGDADFAGAMTALRRILHEKGLKTELYGADGNPLRSAPPVNRRHMLPEALDSSVLRRIKEKLGLTA